MAAKGGDSRAGSISIDVTNGDGRHVNANTHLLNGHHGSGEHSGEHSSLTALARRSTMRKRSFR